MRTDNVLGQSNRQDILHFTSGKRLEVRRFVPICDIRMVGKMSRIIDADALFAVVKRHHDLYNGATNPADKARRDECLQVMCDINDAPTIDAIPVGWMVSWINRHPNDLRCAWFASLEMEWQKEQEANQ